MATFIVVQKLNSRAELKEGEFAEDAQLACVLHNIADSRRLANFVENVLALHQVEPIPNLPVGMVS